MFYDQGYAADIRRKYPAGTRVVLDRMGEDPRPVPPGTKGTVLYVDDIGTVHCSFDSGRMLGLIPGMDSFHRIETKERGAR